MSTPNSQPIKEYALKNSHIDFSHNVMQINSGSTFKLSDLAPPVRMYRDQCPIAPPSEAPMNPRLAEKKKIQIIETSPSDDDDQRVREEEKSPWILEDSEDRVFTGRLEGGQSSNYVLLVNQGNNFHVVPVTKWYRFNPKIQYRTLSIEDAEKSMASSSSKRASENRWLMKATAPEGASLAQGSEAEKPLPSHKLKVASGNVSDSHSNYYAQTLGSGDLDYDVEGMLFQDDDELNPGLDQEEEPNEPNPKSGLGQKKITKWGKELKKIMKHTNDPNLHLYFNGLEESKDPYASDAEEDAEEDSVPDTPSIATAPARMKRTLSGSSLSSSSASQPSSPLLSGTPSTGTVSSFSQEEPPRREEAASIDENSVIAFLKRGPSTAKALIEHFKVQIRINPRNREVIPAILKRVALIKKIEEGGEKVLELREEYRVLSQIS